MVKTPVTKALEHISVINQAFMLINIYTGLTNISKKLDPLTLEKALQDIPDYEEVNGRSEKDAVNCEICGGLCLVLNYQREKLKKRAPP